MKSQILKIENLHVTTADGKEILKGITLSVKQGEIHAVMGPNGSGKSTLAQVLMGHPGFKVTKGKILLNGKNITGLSPDKRAKLGLFLGFQYPVEIEGVNYASFLRTAVNENLPKNKKISPIAFRDSVKEKAKELAFMDDLTRRSLNDGFSGGEKKKSEVLQLSLLKPKFALLDEPDSGLDVDALKYISRALNGLNYSPGLILITHYQRILNHIKPDFVHVLVGGLIAESGDAKLAKKVERKGYEQYAK